MPLFNKLVTLTTEISSYSEKSTFDHWVSNVTALNSMNLVYNQARCYSEADKMINSYFSALSYIIAIFF